jgi:predicted SAM-dependent methyltransferase
METTSSLKIIVGAGGVTQPGWLSLEARDLDIRDRNSWLRRYAPGTVDAVLAEHVLEHLTPIEARAAADNVYEFLKPGGYWRIAVPDGYNPDPDYHGFASPAGVYQRIWNPILNDFPSHQVFYNVYSLTDLLKGSGFAVRPLEWFSPDGQFIRDAWSHAQGQIRKAFGTDHVARMNFWVYGWDNLSLIVDALKPMRRASL